MYVHHLVPSTSPSLLVVIKLPQRAQGHGQHVVERGERHPQHLGLARHEGPVWGGSVGGGDLMDRIDRSAHRRPPSSPPPPLPITATTASPRLTHTRSTGPWSAKALETLVGCSSSSTSKTARTSAARAAEGKATSTSLQASCVYGSCWVWTGGWSTLVVVDARARTSGGASPWGRRMTRTPWLLLRIPISKSRSRSLASALARPACCLLWGSGGTDGIHQSNWLADRAQSH